MLLLGRRSTPKDSHIDYNYCRPLQVQGLGLKQDFCAWPFGAGRRTRTLQKPCFWTGVGLEPYKNLVFGRASG